MLEDAPAGPRLASLIERVKRIETKVSDMQTQVDRLQNGLQNLTETIRLLATRKR